jgi:hypothetical protein
VKTGVVGPRTAKSTVTERVTIPIFGFAFGGAGCRMAEHALARIAGVIRVYINPATEMAYVEFDLDLATPQQLVAGLEEVGIKAGAARRV